MLSSILMSRRIAAICIVGSIVTVAGAAAAPPQGSASVNADGRVVVSSSVCAAVVAHLPDAGVAYTPGVDAHGKPVVPADLPENNSRVNADSVPIELDLDLRKRFKIPTDARLFRRRAELGILSVQGNQVFFNGQPLAGGEASLLAAACRAHGF